MFLRDYVAVTRLHKPVGALLLFAPAALGLIFGAQYADMSYTKELLVFILGAFLMRGAGCVYNDIVDRPFDGGVKRTAARPFVRAENPMALKNGWVIIAGHLALSALLLLFLPVRTWFIAMIAVLLVGLYPWMKRITFWPQLFLGVTFGVGAPMGWFTLSESYHPVILLLYGGSIAWVFYFDTVYGLQDLEDDVLVGVKSSPQALGAFLKPGLIMVVLVYGACLAAAGWVMGLTYFHWVVFVIVLYSLRNLQRLRPHDTEMAGQIFSREKWIGLILVLAAMLG